MNLVRDPNASIEPLEIGAAAEENVLAVVDHFADAWMEIGAGPAAQVTTPLNQLHAQPAFGKGAGSAHSSHASAHHRDGPPRTLLQTVQRLVQLPRNELALQVALKRHGLEEIF
jgi:hypothetical protein